MMNAPSRKYLNSPKKSKLYGSALNYAVSSPFPYVASTTNSYDIFGVGVGYPKFTFAAFFYFPTGTSSQHVVSWSMSSSAPPWSWGTNSIKFYMIRSFAGQLHSGFAKTTDTWQSVMDTLIKTENNSWTHFTVSSDGTSLMHSVNGVFKGSAVWPAAINSINPVYSFCLLSFRRSLQTLALPLFDVKLRESYL